MLGLHQRLYNAALEERIRVYKETGKSLSFSEQCKVLTQWRKTVPALSSLNAQSGQADAQASAASLSTLLPAYAE